MPKRDEMSDFAPPQLDSHAFHEKGPSKEAIFPRPPTYTRNLRSPSAQDHRYTQLAIPLLILVVLNCNFFCVRSLCYLLCLSLLLFLLQRSQAVLGSETVSRAILSALLFHLLHDVHKDSRYERHSWLVAACTGLKGSHGIGGRSRRRVSQCIHVSTWTTLRSSGRPCGEISRASIELDPAICQIYSSLLSRKLSSLLTEA